MGLGLLFKTRFAYRSDLFPHMTTAALLGHVKVSPVRPVPATLTGKIIGKGVPGLIFSDDFVLRDSSGILFLDYNQPLAIWNFLFGLLRAGQYQGQEVCVRGWFRRSPVPYLEIYQLEPADGSVPARTCYCAARGEVIQLPADLRRRGSERVSADHLSVAWCVSIKPFSSSPRWSARGWPCRPCTNWGTCWAPPSQAAESSASYSIR